MNNIPLIQRLPALLPKAIAWAEGMAGQIAEHGQPLLSRDITMARHIGIAQPERVCIAVVDQMPLPDDPDLRAAGIETGLFGPNITGMTLGYSILLVQGRYNRQIVAHELRHVYQYEIAGSISAFLPRYLAEVATMGYEKAPSEVDARSYEYLAAEAS